MVNNVPKRYLLPFLVSSDESEKISKDMELASILCLTELNRSKGSGFISKSGAEEINFVAEICYPLWFMPLEKRTLLFDGLNVLKHIQTYDVLPDIQVFDNEVRGSSETHEAYYTFLYDNLNYFKGFIDKEEKTIDGLVTNPDFLQDFMSFLPKAKAIKKSMANKIVLSPSLDETTVLTYLNDLSEIRTALKLDISNLRATMKLLNDVTSQRIKIIRKEIKETQKEFNEKIAKIKTVIMEKRREIKRNYNKEITNLSRTFEQQLRGLRREQIKAQNDKQRLIEEIDRFETEVKNSKIKKDEVGEAQYRRRIGEHKQTLSTLEKKITNLNNRLEDIEASKKIETSELKTKYDTQVSTIMEEMREVEAFREATILKSQEEMESMEDRSSTIINQIAKLLELKETAIAEINMLSIPTKRRKAQVYIHFYLACYQRGMEKRYVVYPPSLTGDQSILTKFRGVFGSVKIKSLLKDRSKSLTNFVNQIITLIEQDPIFEEEISEAGKKVNILGIKESRKRIKKGLEELNNREWVSKSEFETINSIIE